MQYRSIDGAGNTSAWTPASATAGSTARIDRTAPTAPAAAGGSLLAERGDHHHHRRRRLRAHAGRGRATSTAPPPTAAPAGARPRGARASTSHPRARRWSSSGHSMAPATPAPSAPRAPPASTAPTPPLPPSRAARCRGRAWRAITITGSGASAATPAWPATSTAPRPTAARAWSAATAGASVNVTAEGETLVQYRSDRRRRQHQRLDPGSATAARRPASTAPTRRRRPSRAARSPGRTSPASPSPARAPRAATRGWPATSTAPRTDGGSSGRAPAAGASVNITAEGETLVQYRSIDGAGNVSAWTPASATAGSTARIDRTEPTAPTVSGGSLTLAERRLDHHHRLGRRRRRLGPGRLRAPQLDRRRHRPGARPAAGASVNITAEGETLVQYRSIDGAGNTSRLDPRLCHRRLDRPDRPHRPDGPDRQRRLALLAERR